MNSKNFLNSLWEWYIGEDFFLGMKSTPLDTAGIVPHNPVTNITSANDSRLQYLHKIRWHTEPHRETYNYYLKMNIPRIAASRPRRIDIKLIFNWVIRFWFVYGIPPIDHKGAKLFPIILGCFSELCMRQNINYKLSKFNITFWRCHQNAELHRNKVYQTWIV